jgi:hypothetical protein
MKLSELGFDFSNASSFTMLKKNRLARIYFLIIGFIMLSLLLVFGILFILKVPMDNHGVTYNFGDPEYNKIYITILTVFGVITLACLIGYFSVVFLKSKKYIIKSLNTEGETFYYIYDRSNEIYLTKEKLLIFKKNLNKLYDDSKPEQIENAFQHYIFWEKFNDITDYRIKALNKKTILKFKLKIGRIAYTNTYKFEDIGSVLPGKITESITYSNRGNNRIQRMNTYYLESINQSQSIDYPREMLQAINQIN